MTDWIKVQGSQPEKPDEFDLTSSRVFVYQRRNIQRVSVEQEDGMAVEFWEYEERKLSRGEYLLVRDNLRLEQAIAALENALCEIDAGN